MTCEQHPNSEAASATYNTFLSIYITHQPCIICSKMIINAGIKRIVVREGYPDNLAKQILSEAGLSIIMLGEEK